ncbi:MAG TPA: HNH endonuclease signature motif containing protein [Patescibacteria group bacterium]|nr:HNH endonuclease signature motif containing protein [Patescibacteria group bacterium]
MSNLNRLSIPAELARQIKLEAGHRCAIPTCRQWPVELAHIIPYRVVKDHSFDNLVLITIFAVPRLDWVLLIYPIYVFLMNTRLTRAEQPV